MKKRREFPNHGGLEPTKDHYIFGMEKLFPFINSMLYNNPGIDSSLSGSTGVIALVNPKYIVVGGIGDSRAFLFRKSSPSANDGSVCLSPFEMTKLHTPYDQVEADRILSRGGEVRPANNFDGESIGPLRVWQAKSKFPGLMMTRSFGDKMGHNCGMNAIPCRFNF